MTLFMALWFQPRRGKKPSHENPGTFCPRTKPQSDLSIDLRLAPVQGGSPHNRISIEIKDQWPGGEYKLAEYLPQSVLPDSPDYAKVSDPSQEDQDRLNEFRRSYTPQELLQMMAERQKRPPELPFGPYRLP